MQSWIVELNQTSQDEFPVQRVVKKVYTVSNKEKNETDISVDLPLREKKVFTKAPEKDNVEKDNVKKVVKGAVKIEKKNKAKVMGTSCGNKKNKEKIQDDAVGDVEDIT